MKRLSWFVRVAALWMCSFAASAACTNLAFINPMSDIDWDCIFPITIAGIPIDEGEHPPDDDQGAFFCECAGKGIYGTPGFGFLVTFWEPARLVDTVADAWCFPAIGVNMSNTGNTEYSTSSFGYTGGGSTRGGMGAGAEAHTFQHYHYYIFPVWAILDMFTDMACEESESSFDLAMVSEVRPDWGDDTTAMQLYPETSLMGNPGVVFACIADAVASTVEEPIDALYWCMGSWGLTYPMTGNITSKDYTEANAGEAGRALYLQARNFMLPDRAIDYCEEISSPIWVKSHYRLQEVDPVDESQCHTLGEPGLLWTWNKNPPGLSDNFSWLLFRKVRCCVILD